MTPVTPEQSLTNLFPRRQKKQLLRLGPNKGMAAALHELWHGDMTKALLMFRAIGEAYPKDARAYYFASLSVYQAGCLFQDLEKRRATVQLAESLMRHCISVHDPKDPNLAYAHYNLGKFLLDLNQANESLAAFLDAVELHPEFPEALNNAG
jgi:tetratricopeptide (TPR) repeat protein